MKALREDWKTAATVALSLILAGTTCRAGAADDWEFSLSPLFLWGKSIDGDAAIDGKAAPLDLDFIRRLIDYCTRHDLAIRSWAIAEPKLRELVKRTDDHRLNYLKMLFSGIGFDPGAADLRARVFLGEAAWEAALFRRMSRRERARKADAFFELLVAGAAAD